MINAVEQFLESKKEKQITIFAVGKKGYDALLHKGYSVEKYFPVPTGAALSADLRTSTR